MRILGIDYGAKRVGLALGDTDSRLATPWSIIPNEGAPALLVRVRDILAREDIQVVIVGVPKRLRQSRQQYTPAREIDSLIANLSSLRGVKVYTEDETMSSRLALRQAQEGRRSGSQDDLAAAAILQTWLDRRSL